MVNCGSLSETNSRGSREHFFQPMDHLGRSDVIGEQDFGKLGEVVCEYHNVLGVGQCRMKWTHDVDRYLLPRTTGRRDNFDWDFLWADRLSTGSIAGLEERWKLLHERFR